MWKGRMSPQGSSPQGQLPPIQSDLQRTLPSLVRRRQRKQCSGCGLSGLPKAKACGLPKRDHAPAYVSCIAVDEVLLKAQALCRVLRGL